MRASRSERSVVWRVFQKGVACAALVSSAATAEAAPRCGAGAAAEATSTRQQLLDEARAASFDDRARARALFLALLTRDPSDAEARTGLARADAWDGCTTLAENGYREVLAARPEAVDARAGLIDLLSWTGRWDEAEVQLAEGLQQTPLAPELLARRARLLHWRGEEIEAVRSAELAERLAPNDADVRALRDQLFRGEGRLGFRAQLLPPAYDDVYTLSADGLQRWRRMHFTLGSAVVTRTGALARATVVDLRRSVGAYYHLRNGAWAGVALSHTTPATALARYTAGVAALTPILRRWTAYVTANVWSYKQEKTVYIVGAAIGWAATDTVDLEVRGTLSDVVSSRPDAEQLVQAVGVRATWRPDSKLALTAEYNYGAELDQNPAVAQLIELRSHIFTVSVRRMFTRELGVQPTVSWERRESLRSGALLGIPAFELSLIVRW